MKLLNSIIIFVFSVLYLYLERFLYTFSDAGIFAYGALRIINGEILYKDFFASNSPLNYFLLALLFKIFSPATTVTLWTTFVVLGLISVGIYLVSKEVNFSEVFSYLMVCFFIFPQPLKFFEYSHHWLSSCSAIFAIYFFLRFVKNRLNSVLFLAGVFTGITTGFFHPKGVLLFLGLLLSMVFIEFGLNKLKYYLTLIIGYLLPILLISIYFLFNNAFYDFFYDLFIWPVKNYNFLHNYPSYYYPQKVYLSEVFKSGNILSGSLRLLPALFIGYNFLISLGILAGLFLLKGREIFKKNKLEIIFFIITFFLFFSTLYRPDDFRMGVISPITNICFFLIAYLLLQYFIPVAKNLLLKRIIVLLFILIPLGEAFWSVKKFVGLKLTQEEKYYVYNTQRGPIFLGIGSIWESIKEIEIFKNALDEFKIKKIFIYPCVPTLYFLFDLENPTSYDCIIPFYNTPKEFDKLFYELNKEDVKLILFAAYYLVGDEQYFPVRKGHKKEELEAVEPMINYLHRNYTPVFHLKYIQKSDWSDYLITLYLKK